MRDLASLTVSDFAGLSDRRFDLVAGEVVLRLDETKPLGRAQERPAFSVLFHGPADHPLEQGIHELRHATLGSLALFLVPVAGGPDGYSYEAIFG